MARFNLSDPEAIQGLGKNSAGRLYHVLARLQEVARQDQAIKPAWKKVLGIALTFNDARDDLLITEGLQAIGREIDTLELAVAENGIPNVLMARFLSMLRDALHVQLINTSRDSTLQYLKPEVLVALHWCSFVLPDEAEGATAEEFQALRLQIDELEKALQQEGIPPHFRKYAVGLLESLKRAMFLFPIQGLQPMRDAVRKAVADANFDEEKLQEELAKDADKPAVKSVLTTLSSALKTAATTVGEGEKLMKGYGYMLEMAHKAGEFISNSVSP